MKKKYYLIAVFVMVALLIAGGTVNAEPILTDYGQIIPYFGISYNTFDLNSENFTFALSEKFYDDEEDLDEFGDYYDINQSVSSGVGFHFGALHWFDAEEYENMALGAEFERINTVEMSDQDVRIQISNLGFLATGAYRLKDIDEEFPGYIDLLGGIGLYRARFSMRDRIGNFNIQNSYWGPGLKIGLQGGYLFEEQEVALGGRVGYRYARPHSEGDLNYNGFEVGLQLSFGF